MKKPFLYLIFFFYLISFYGLKAQDWEWVNPVPQGNKLNDIFCVDSNIYYAVGNTGTIIKTEDGGRNWEVQKSGTSYNLTCLWFTDKYNGYVIGDGGGLLFITKNGGKNWVKKNIPKYHFNSIYFTDSETGYIVGMTGMIMKTTDAGESWFLSWEVSEEATSIYFLNKKTGFVICDYGEIVKTSNGGESWENIDTEVRYGNTFDQIVLKSIFFADSTLGYIVGYNYETDKTILLKSTDGGNNWEVQYKDEAFKIYTQIYFVNKDIGFLYAGENVKKTYDGGNSWKDLDIEIEVMDFIDDYKGISIYSINHIYKTYDEGETWTEQSKAVTTYDLNSVYFIDSLTGFATGGDYFKGIIIKTTDGGKNWITQFNDSTGYLKSIFFCDKNIGYAVGNSWVNDIKKGIVLKTIDGGINWTYLIKNNLLNYNSVFFTSTDTGYVAGSSYIYKTVDGGMNWNVSFHETGIYFNSVFFVNSNVGFAAGSSSSFFKTVDGGKNWNNLIKYNINSIYFINVDTGYTAGPYGNSLLKTIDGGGNWKSPRLINPEDNPYYPDLKSIFFVNDSIGYVAGTSGTILSSYDGGNNWKTNWGNQYNHETLWDLNSVYFSDENHGWIVGEYGTILKYKPKKDTGVYIKDNLKEKENLVLYPNPASSYISLKSEYTIKKISIFNLTGKNILEKEINCKNTFLNIENLPQGFYIVNFTFKDKIKTMKLIKK